MDRTAHVDSVDSEEDNSRRSCCGCCNWVTTHLSPVTLCPDTNIPLRVLTAVVLTLLIWGTLHSIFGDLVAPQSNYFMLIILFVVGFSAGKLIALVRLPPLLAMLMVGIIIGNLGVFTTTGHYGETMTSISNHCRSIALVVILIRAGLGLDPAALRRLSLVVLRLSFIPCLSEVLAVCVVSHFLMGFPWLWGLLMGFVLGAVSPVVVVTSVMMLKKRGYGVAKGIPTLTIAASSIDDILAISGFGIVLGSIFATGNLTEQIIHGPLEVLMGLSFGISWGIFLIYIPHRADEWVVPIRSVLVGCGGVFAVLGSQLVGYSGAGPLACITQAFTANCGWRALSLSNTRNPVVHVFSILWQLFEPVLFGLIGIEMNLSQLNLDFVGQQLGVLFVGLMVRMCACFLAVSGADFNVKEKLFVCIAWLPKATVQAAIGPVALDIARKSGYATDSMEITYATQVLALAIISILLTAPLGAVGICVSGPRLLTKTIRFRGDGYSLDEGPVSHL